MNRRMFSIGLAYAGLAVATVAGSGLLAGCGFQLRGSSSLPFKTIYVSTPENSQLGNELKRNIRAGTSTALAPNPQTAEARFDVLTELREKEILSLNSAGRVREYVLRYRVVFRVVDQTGKVLIPATDINLKRDISFNESAILATESEEALLYRDMQSDVVQQILRRMATVRAA